ncbi:MAG: prolyl oligopeptidase [Phycisphaerae bacterium]|nr:prolyl oligopeptidase [Phycisphaerae bacterium]
MRRLLNVLSVGVAAAACAPLLAGPPETEARPVTDTYHGETFVDPYRWLEGDNSDPSVMGRMTEEVAAWTDAQNSYTRSVLDRLPGRSRLEARIKELLEVGEIGLPRAAGSRVFYTRRDGAQPQAVLYVRDAGSDDARELLDPAKLDDSGLTSLDWYSPSPDGDLVAFGLSFAGDENSTLYLMNTATGEWLADEIPGKTRMSGWLRGSDAFFYSRLEDLDDAYSSTTAYHEIGRHWRNDPVVVRQRSVDEIYAGMGKTSAELETLRGTWGPFAYPSEDGRWLVLGYYTGTSSLDLWIADLDRWVRTGELEKKAIVTGEDGRHNVTISGGQVFMQTPLGAPNGRIVRIDPYNPSRANWIDIVPNRDDATLSGFSVARGVLAASYLKDAYTQITLHGLDGKNLGSLRLPGIGSASLSTNDDRADAYLAYESYNEPDTIYKVDLTKPDADPEVWESLDVPVDGSDLEVRRVTYTSKDGTPVGMFIVHKKGIALNGDNPTILYGYGGFNISMTPRFGSTMFPWFENGGVYAVANLRGGGEKGLSWHKSGQLDKKQNVFDDFIAAGEWLVENGYTSPERLGVAGGSNGGLLTGAVVTQRPDLFAAVISAVPLLDMLRFENFLMAKFWVPEYGSAQSDRQYGFIRGYSPYQNVKPGTKYPAVLFTAGENDTRVHPMHARKMAALMQASTTADPAKDPILLWVDRQAGHGSGKPLELRVRDIVDQRIFMMWQLGMIGDG